MTLLIDGYNLLHASGVFPPACEPPTLEAARRALLDFLVKAVAPKLVPRTIVVFDAVDAPPGLPRAMVHGGLAVQFARRGGTADEVLEELIGAEPDPRNLLVVSSDHRVQRAARQRGAQFIDSEIWVRQMAPENGLGASPSSDKPVMGLENPFPPGYGEDLV